MWRPALQGIGRSTIWRLLQTCGLPNCEAWRGRRWIGQGRRSSGKSRMCQGKALYRELRTHIWGTRRILLSQTTLNELREHRQRTEAASKASSSWRENDLVFRSTVSTPFGMNDVHTDFAQVLKSANLRRIRFHDLRHTATTLMLDHGVPASVVSRMMGHANPSVTLNIHAHSTLDMQTRAADVMDEIVTPLVISIPQPQPIAANRCCD